MIARYPPRSLYYRSTCLKIITSNNSRSVAITFAIALVAASVKGEEAGGPVSGKRQPKLFYISSSTTTSTVSTSTVCFKSGTALATCSKKKRKRDILETMEEMEEALLKENKISPSLSGNEDVVEEEHNLRDPRLFTTFNY